MELRHLTALVAVADHGSFSAAARALVTVQSNVSAHVARLERELGTVLVDRAHGRLTPEGEVVVARARQVQHELAALRTDVASLRTDVRGEVHLGLIGSTARWLAPLLLVALHDRYAGVRPILVEASTTSLVPRLLESQLDLAVVNLPVTGDDVHVDVLFAEDLVVVVPPSHELATHDEIDLAALAGHPLLLPAPGTALRDDLETEARAAGVTLRPLAEIDGVRLMTSLAFDGFGATIVPATAVPGWVRGDFACIPVRGVPPRQVGLARRRQAMLSAPSRAVADVIVEVVQSKAARQAGVHLLAAG